MTSKQKILLILDHIKRESEINVLPKWVLFKFNHWSGKDIPSKDEERRILMKLDREKILELHVPDGEDEWINDEENPIEFMMKNDFIWIKIVPKFYREYFWYSIITPLENKWNYINPFWLVWQLLKGLVFLIEFVYQKSKLLTVIVSTVGGFLIYDWSKAWKNISAILEFFKNL